MGLQDRSQVFEEVPETPLTYALKTALQAFCRNLSNGHPGAESLAFLAPALQARGAGAKNCTKRIPYV